MSLFQQLEKLNIPLEELENLTEKEIIRIEKKLKADVVFNKSIDINEVNQIIDSLKNNKVQLSKLTRKGLYWFREIVSNPHELITFPINQIPKEEADEETKQFIEDNFSKELTSYFTQCIKNNHYRALHCFLFYHNTLPNSILNEIENKLLQKIDYGIECMNIEASSLDDKIFFLYNPFFFKSLNFLDPIRVETRIPSLVNLVIQKSKTNKTLYRIHFCLGMFIPVSDNLKRIVKKNQSFAMSKGVSQQLDYKKHPKGETYSVADNYQLGQLKSYLAVFIVASILLIIAFFVGLAINSSSSETTKEKVDPYSIQSFIDDALVKQSFTSKTFPTKVVFNKDTIGFRDMNLYTLLEPNILIKNNSDKHVAIIMGINELGVGRGYSILCIRPHEERFTSCQFSDYSIYQGHYPSKFSYFDKDGKFFNQFYFEKFDYKDKNMLKTIRKNPTPISSDYEYIYELNYGVLDLISKKEKLDKELKIAR